MTVLSICIPTYNRCEKLEKCLCSLVSQDVFLNDDSVEIVVCDNFSDDKTKDVCEKFTKLYPKKFVYVRRESAIPADENILGSINFANGDVVKLSNDTLIYSDNSLEKLLGYIKNNEDCGVFFVLNNHLNKKIMQKKCDNLDDFIEFSSYFTTAIACFGVRKSAYDKLSNPLAKIDTKLAQVDILCQLVSGGEKALVINEKLFSALYVGRKGGYNIAEIFCKNYLNILNIYVKTGSLSQKIFNIVKKAVLPFVVHEYFDVSDKFDFKKGGFFSYIFEFYKKEPYFYYELLKVVLEYILVVFYRHNKDEEYKYYRILGFTFKKKWKNRD